MLKKLHHKIVFINMLLVGIVLLAVLAVFCYNEARLSRQMISDDLSRSIGFLQQTPFRDFREMFPQDDNGEYYFLTPYDEDDFDLDARSEDDDDRTEGATVWHVQQDMQQENGQKQIPGAPDSSTQAAGPQRDSSSLPSGTVAVAVSSDGAYLETYSNGFSLSDEELDEAVSLATASGSAELKESQELGLFYQTAERDGTRYLAFADAASYHEDLQSTIVKAGVMWLIIMALFFLISVFMARVAVKPVKESWDRQQEFVADASHELKTPLTVILANNNILLDPARGLAEEDRKWVESTQDEAAHMKTLVDQLLFLARSDSGDQKMLLSDLDLGDMVMDDVLQFEPVAFERGILIEPDLEPDIHIEGDSTMIRQLIHILLDNACKYAAANGTIDVSLKRERQGCTLAVHNPGPAIPADDLPHIFERFYRADKARTHKENTSGYGLGLAIAKSIAEDHNGTIQCTSTDENGTTFTVRFRERLR